MARGSQCSSVPWQEQLVPPGHCLCVGQCAGPVPLASSPFYWFHSAVAGDYYSTFVKEDF